MWIDAHQHVGHSHELELSVLGVGEVDLGFPDGLHQVGVVQVQGLGDVTMVETLVHPSLTKVQVNLVILKKKMKTMHVDNI